MKLKQVKLVYSSATKDQVDVEINVDINEANELMKALNVIEKYKKCSIKSINEIGFNPEKSDWMSSDFYIKNNLVCVSIKHGMCG